MTKYIQQLESTIIRSKAIFFKLGANLIIEIGQYSGKSIKLQTRQGNDIKNFQPDLLSSFEISWNKKIYKQYGNKITLRTNPSPYYNCHGMTFASRRTRIWDPAEIKKIIVDDNYLEIPEDSIMPGDVVIYFGDKGDVEHSGIVLKGPDETKFKVPVIMSKWGQFAEVIHELPVCPYDHTRVKYYRIKK